MPKKKLYIANKHDALCRDCGDQCHIAVELDAMYREYYLSRCCSSDLVTLDGSEFEPELCEGEDAP